MKIARNVKAISRLLLILLLLLALIIGAIFSYLVVIGYYITLETNIPDNPALSITETNFDPHNAEKFTLTILNPTYSAGDVNITEISLITQDNEIHKVSNVEPKLPAEIKKGKDETFQCIWNWGNYTGETIKVIVLVDDGSGSTYTIKTSNVNLIISPLFAVASTQQFNLTLNHLKGSAVDLKVTNMTITPENEAAFSVELINRTYPQLLIIDTITTLQCSWDWEAYKGTTIHITIFTQQNITFYHTEKLPEPSVFTIKDFEFDPEDTTTFKMSIEISDPNITSANITAVGTVIGDQAEQLVVESPRLLPYHIKANETITFTARWGWTDYEGELITFALETEEGYYGYTSIIIPTETS